MAERSATKTASQEETSNRISSGLRSSKRGRQQNAAPKWSGSNQTVPQKRDTSKNRGAFSNRLQEDARIHQNIERGNISLLERIAKVMNPPGGALVSSAYNLKRPPKFDREEIKLKQQKREKERLAIENENLAILERLATIMAPQPGGPSWNDYKKSNTPKFVTKMPKILPSKATVNKSSGRPRDMKLKEVPVRQNSIEIANLAMLERLAKIMASPPGGLSWKDYEKKRYGPNQRATQLPSIFKDKDGVNKKRYTAKDQNDGWRDINQKLPAISSNSKKNGK
ncbi:uncharacterized protein [Narcine bancroftii]|uniref:uncharacterized protein isoform X3 n=1 Tax=Narcine bancroftii TaxID=1343680 RepID=UPI0038315164